MKRGDKPHGVIRSCALRDDHVGAHKYMGENPAA